VARHASSLGLRTLAMEVCERAGLGEVGAQAGTLADDRLAVGRLTRGVRSCCHALADRVDLRGHIDGWRARAEREVWCSSGDGNVVVRRADGRWEWVRDSRGIAERFELPFVTMDPDSVPDELEPPVYIDGLDGGWLLDRVWRCTPRSSCGYQARIHVVEEGIDRVLDAMASGVVHGVCADARVEWFVGDGAHERFGRWLREREGYGVRGTVLGGSCVGEVVEEMYAHQITLSESLRGRVEAMYGERDATWWRGRYDEAGGGGASLRVLVLSTAHSTFLRHSGEDLVEAWYDAGHEARLVCEPDRHTSLKAPSYLRVIEDFEPDLVMVCNFTRRQLANVIPVNVPFVCWIQDRMAHLFDPELVRTRGRLDYFVGHLYGEVFAREGMERGSWSSPVLVSGRKFHDGDADEELRERFACDVAYVSHQSQSVEELYAECVRGVSSDPLCARLLVDIKDEVLERFADTEDESPYRERFRLAANLYRFKGRGRSKAMQGVDINRMWDMFGARLAERFVRMQTLEWARELCEAHDWTMRLYGNGWDRHPSLGGLAAGEIGHGEELRACYRCAGAHLHASAHTVGHQRVFECVLSGGMMLRRIALEDLHRIEHEIARREAERVGHEWGEPLAVASGWSEFLGWYNEMRSRLGMNEKDEIVIKGKLLDAIRHKPAEDVEHDALARLPEIERTVFRDKDGLERVLGVALGDAEAR
ncbi:MAG: hypothetical protein ACYTF7_12165, partial [Planctomycetota bacterium]